MDEDEDELQPPEENASRREDPGDSEPVDDRPIDAFVRLAQTRRKCHFIILTL